MNDDPGSRMHEITDVPIREKADNDDKIFEERNDEDLKVEEGYVDANAQLEKAFPMLFRHPDL